MQYGRARMPEVFPFRGLRFAASRPANLSRLIAPPYDVISPAIRAELAARSPHNVVHLTLGEDRTGDGPGENRHVRAGRWLRAWIEEGALRLDAGPAYYALEQSFAGPDGRPRVRRGLVAACRLHPYADGLILPHEKTLDAPKADRLELLRHVQCNLSPVFGLYEDDGGEGQRALEGAVAGAGEPIAEADSDDGTHHRLWRVQGQENEAPLRRVLARRKVVIADGHHRYQAALEHRDAVDAARPGLPENAGHRYVMMALCSMADPGLVIYPTHRLVAGLGAFRLQPFLDALARVFVVETLAEDLRRPAGRAWAVARLAEHSGKSTTFLMVSAEDGKGRILTLRDDAEVAGMALPDDVTLRDLDVTALHDIVFRHLLGIRAGAGVVRYEMDAGEIVSRTLSAEYQLGFLVNPTPMWQVQAVAESGQTMPEKSTFFYPKMPTGLVMRLLDEPLAG